MKMLAIILLGIGTLCAYLFLNLKESNNKFKLKQNNFTDYDEENYNLFNEEEEF